MMMLNKGKNIGQVLFIVEGSKYEFSLLHHIFCNVLDFEYIEKRRNKANYYTNKVTRYSKVAVVNTEESNISFISDESSYLDEIFELLINEYDFPVDKSAIYYLFDRDPKSNCNTKLIEELISSLTNPYENADGMRGGLILLSYPSIESYTITNFCDNAHLFELALGHDVKALIAANTRIQLNKITTSTIEKATCEMMKYFEVNGIGFDIDNFSAVNREVFEKQENNYAQNANYRLLSLLSVAFIQLGIIELDSTAV